jgi:arginyl-tRNA synthetase
MNVKATLDHLITQTLHTLYPGEEAKANVQIAKNPLFGDYQSNGIMGLAKRLGRNPRDLAHEIVNKLKLDEIASKVEVAGPGFINISLSTKFLTYSLNSLDGQTLVSQATQPQKIVIDYSSPNLAKEMHVGHLRGTIIGDALARTFDYLGHTLIRQNHFGDWGTQFGMLITFLQELPEGSEHEEALANLETFYRAAKERFDADTQFAEKSRANVVKLQSGDEQCQKMWQRFIKVSITHCQALYKRLGITLTEQDMAPESFYNSKLANIIKLLDTENLLKESDGARCVFLPEFKNRDEEPLPLIVQKSDGGYLYATTDLAAINYRCQTLQAERILYVVDARQSLHFQQVFAVAHHSSLVSSKCSLEHISYGTMMGKDGKPFKTRSGDTIKLIDLCEEGVERAFKLVSGKNPDLPKAQREIIANTIGIAAIKYADLSKNRNSDYVFDWDSMLSMEGNTAPYLLYAFARICSIFRRAELSMDDTYSIEIQSTEERALAVKLLQFSEVVHGLTEECLPNQLCLYLYELAGVYMKFYEACPVIKSEGAEKISRLGLCQITARTLKQGLELLGITPLEQM